jgi:hypothetical protein
MVSPYNYNDPDTEMINTRRSVPVPHAYVPLFAFRTLSPSEAWQQIGEQIILDGRQQDCMVLLNFLRAATVKVRGNIRNQRTGPPAVAQIEDILPPIDGELMQHTRRRLRIILPTCFLPAPNNGLPALQAAALIGQTVTEGFNALRADRLQERENTNPKSFSEQFPANGAAIRRLCLAGNDDDQLPEFWQFFASVKGKKGQALPAFNNFLINRASQAESAGVLPIISPQLFNNISSFELGSSNLEVITRGVSPFLMCTARYEKADEITVLSQRYMLHHEGAIISSEEISKLASTNHYAIPTDLHMLVDFIGAYSVVWDVLLGELHPLAISLCNHFRFWQKHVESTIIAIPETILRTTVIIGTLRHIQLKVLAYVHNKMHIIEQDPDIPTFTDVVNAIQGRTFQTLPALPARYHQRLTLAQLPPIVHETPTPPSKRTPSMGNHVTAPLSERHPPLMEKYQAGDKSIQQLRNLPGLPKDKKGNSTLCISYHLRGSCFDNCRRASTHRKLDKVEIDNFLAFLDKHN